MLEGIPHVCHSQHVCQEHPPPRKKNKGGYCAGACGRPGGVNGLVLKVCAGVSSRFSPILKYTMIEFLLSVQGSVVLLSEGKPVAAILSKADCEMGDSASERIGQSYGFLPLKVLP